jgi:tetratricopeptide (TPR) repeat protein
MRLTILLVAISSTCFSQSLEKAKQLFDANKANEAKQILLAFEDDHKDYAAAQYYLGRIAFKEKDLDSAEEYFETAIENDTKVADYYWWYGSAMGNIAQNSNHFQKGILAPRIKEAFENTVRLDPKHLAAHWGLIEFYTQAPGFMGGSWEKAESTAKAIIKFNPGEGHHALGTVYERQEKFTEAEKELITAYKENPDYIHNLSSYYVRQKKFTEAFKLFENGLKKDPANMLYVYQVGKLSALSGKELTKGEEALLKYLTYEPKQNEPSHAGANLRLAQIKEKSGNKAEARKLYELALKQDSSMKEAQEGLQRLK